MSVTAGPSAARESGRAARLAVAAAASILVIGGMAGLRLNRTPPRPSGTLLAAGAPVVETPDAAAQALAPVEAAPGRPLFSVRAVEITPPDDPFRPVAAAPAPAAPAAPAAPLVSIRSSAMAPPARAVVPGAPAAASGSAPAAAPAAGTSPAPRADELVVTGIIHGDPVLAVVSYAGQSLFLKIGDQVADTWRLVEVKERSAIFQLGAQRVEVPIKGGSSE